MLHPVKLNDEEYARLLKAKQTGNWKVLLTWKEKYLFQRTIATKSQVQEIAAEARKYNLSKGTALRRSK